MRFPGRRRETGPGQARTDARTREGPRCELRGRSRTSSPSRSASPGAGHGRQLSCPASHRGLAETARLGQAMGADPLTFSGLAGASDLIATRSSPLSRNRTFGEHLGQGMSVKEATTATGQTVERVKSCRAILELSRVHGVEMPITEVVTAVIDGTTSVPDAAAALMSRTPKPEQLVQQFTFPGQPSAAGGGRRGHRPGEAGMDAQAHPRSGSAAALVLWPHRFARPGVVAVGLPLSDHAARRRDPSYRVDSVSP
ncbi:NAD(P)H-dependent glycerol-3-phosphate dehydrogenase [Streptomyces sp. NPDC059618]|uniref:NAD(P)H-dependent glycerol-3-phosphate dehydrogenase n=1 Tax=Streptomyces sp. NPDC059618 TaxID=3346887 RepID=UPI0036C2937B